MKRKRRRTRKKQRKILIMSSLFFLFILVSSYAAFQTNLTITAKGNIYNKADKCYETKDNGDGTISITDYDKTCGSELIIPEKIKGKTVTQIANGGWSNTNGFFGPFYNKALTKVEIPDTVLTIGDNSFVGNNIKELKLGNNITTIGTEAFASNKITTLILPKSLNKIGVGAFRNNLLTTIEIPSSVTYLGGGAFAYNTFKEENAIIYGRNSDGSINYEELNSCAIKNGSNLTLPNVTTIASNACRGVYFENLVIPSNVKSVGPLSFSGNNSKTITLNENLKTISQQAFENGQYTEVTIPNSVIQVGTKSFRNTKLQTVNIGSGINSISEDAFSSNENLKTITINKKENSISNSPWGAFNAKVNWIGAN